MNDANPGSTPVHEVAVMPTRDIAESAVHALIEAGFAPADISLFVHAPDLETRVKEGDDQVDVAIEEGGETGATVGAALGGLSGMLVGIGLLAIPGLGPLLAVGPLAAAVTLAITGGSLGGVAGALIGLGVSKTQAEAAERQLQAGRTVMIVRCASRRTEALKILRGRGALCGDLDEPG